MKIVQAIPSMNIGGAERVVLNSVRLLQQRGHQIMVVSSGGVLLDELDSSSTHVEADFLFKRDAVSISKSVNFLKGQFEAWQPDIIHAHSFIALMQSWFAVKKIPGFQTRIVYTIHGLEKEWTWSLIRYVSPLSADKIITVSPYHYNRLTEWGLSKDLVCYIPNGIANSHFEEREEVNKEVRRELGIPLEKVLIGSVCRLVEIKGVHFLLASLALVNEETCTLIVGDGPEQGRLKNLAEELGTTDRVIFTGYRRDAPRLMQSFDIFCSVSTGEAFPIVLLEAMQAKTAIICSQWDGAEEILGDAAKLVPVADVSRLAETINQLVLDPYQREQLGCDGFLRFKERYTLDKVINSLEHIYFDLMEI